MWKHYFGPGARIIGIDIDPVAREYAEDQVEIVIGDQGDRKFLSELRERVGAIDIFIDDGGHFMNQQIATFEEMWPAVTEGGVYLIEDVHTSYWPEYGGGRSGELSFVEFAKALVDSINAWHARDLHPEDRYTTSMRGMHVYESVFVFDKGEVNTPADRMSGRPSFELSEAQREIFERPIDDLAG
jgi:hypothetical protein